MKTLFLTIAVAGFGITAFAASTINDSNRHAYGANIGWLNAQGDVANGAVIGEYVCSGYVWGANVGWIHLGDGTPANGVRYQNNSASDFGVNHDGLGHLRGFAYAANIGWINFETNGAPKFDLKTGALSGHVWSANCGWISLSNAFAHVQTDFLQPGLDADADGITDAWELSYTNTLTAFTATSDTDGDGLSDLAEHVADTSPLDLGDVLRIANYGVMFSAGNDTDTVTWSSKATRCYGVQYRTNLNASAAWFDALSLVSPDPGPETTRIIPFGSVAAERYFRVRAFKPLSP